VSVVVVTDAADGGVEDRDINRSGLRKDLLMLLRSRSIAVLTAVLSLSSVAGASAAATTHTSAKTSSHVSAKTVSIAKVKGSSGVVKPVKTGGGAIALISAFPTGGKGSGTAATCDLWSDRLQEDQDAQDNATDKQTVIDTTQTLGTDIDNALSAGCAVLY
jgi:hypothetical protein